MDCSGKDDCQCNDCNYDSQEDERSCSAPRILNKLPAGAIPINQYHNGGRVKYAPSFSSVNRCPPPTGSDCPITLSVPIFPLNNLVGLESGTEGRISISFLPQGRQITFAWEPFRGQLGSRGISSLTLSTSLPYLPIYSISIPIMIEYNGISQIGKLTIDPKAPIETLKYYFNINGQANTLYGDIIQIPGGNITYIAAN